MYDTALLYPAIALAYALGWLVIRMTTPVYTGAALAAREAKAVRTKLRRAMPAALESGEIFLVYQPKLQLRTGNVEGVEALIRWEHADVGTVPRNLMISLAEESGQIRELTIWVIRRAIEDQALLANDGQPIEVHVNVSAGLLTDAQFVRETCALLKSARGTIGIEITETAVITHSPTALVNLKRMIDHGVSVSIDDYGSGLSSLAYLKELPARELKIDKMFVSGMTMSHRDPLIVRSTIDLAHALGLSVVAEGVESLGVLALLRVMGCDAAQGYLISPPLPLFGLRRYLEAGDYRLLLSDAAANLSPPANFWARTGRELDVAHVASSLEP